MDQEILHCMALSMVPQVGPVLAKTLIRHFGSAQKVMESKKHKLVRVHGIGEKLADSLLADDYVKIAKDEWLFCKKNKIQVIPFLDDDYPVRLRQCDDAPMLFYFKGARLPIAKHVVAVVGSRQATEYGRSVCKELISAIANYDPCIVSGMAYGIDVTAHKEAMKQGLNTVGVLGHGFNYMYPADHRSIANEMLEIGGLLTEFSSQVKPDRENFPARNRIIAGLCDLVIVVEAKEQGGALITAEIAASYNRDVMAVPGRINDLMSRGCLNLIQSNTAQILCKPEDIIHLLGWSENKRKAQQTKLFIDLSNDEQSMMAYLIDKQPCHYDQIALDLQWASSRAALTLLQLEMHGLIIAMPGKHYRVAH